MNTLPNRTGNPFLIATASTAGLGDFPIGSLESRAAARSLLAARIQVQEQQQIFCVVRDIYGNVIDLAADDSEPYIKGPNGEIFPATPRR